MSGNVSEKKRLLSVSRGNLRDNNLSLDTHFDFFPGGCFIRSDNGAEPSENIRIFYNGRKQFVETELILGPNKHSKKHDKIRFKKHDWVKLFFDKHRIQEGDVLAIERLDVRSYRIYPFQTKNIRTGTEIPEYWTKVKKNKPTMIDLFAGCGGFSLGLHQAGFQTLIAVEWDESCCETYRENLSTRILNCAIQEIEQFPLCDLLVGGPPCQGFSNLGERVPNDPRRQLWRHFLRAVEDANPLVFVMENVQPLLKSAEYQEIYKHASALGYKIEGRVLNAAFYGVPQQRKRAFVIGSRIGYPKFPPPTHRNPTKDPTFADHGLPPWRTVRDAISDLPAEPDGNNWHIGRNPTALSKKRYRCIPPGGNRWDLPREIMPECWKRKVSGGTDLFGRLWWDKPSVTIRTEFYKPEKGRYLHPVEHRPITHREAARLQGFPDAFHFIGKKISVGIQIGNSVPPPLGYALGASIIKEIRKHRRKSTGGNKKTSIRTNAKKTNHRTADCRS